MHTPLVISLEQLEYVVYDGVDSLTVTITMNDVASQDVIVEVTITDGTAIGKCMPLALIVECIFYVFIQLGWIIMQQLQCLM